MTGQYDFVVVANRLPVDRVTDDDGAQHWVTSPGGLVTALEPVMKRADGAWIGWVGTPDDCPDPFDADGMHLVPVNLDAEEVENYYEGFSNTTLWPLYHDVIVPPEFHREWWDAYERVNDRFAEAAAEVAAEGAVVWVQDYQLQLVPGMLRRLRPDLKIGFFDHIPFPPYEIFTQLPWRRAVLEGLLGADLIGFQRKQDAFNFLHACNRKLNLRNRQGVLELDDGDTRRVIAKAFPISIDSAAFAELADTPEVVARAAEIRSELGDPEHIVFGVDRLDYTKGIRHRIKAFGELVEDGRIGPGEAVLIQVASPSRERVDEYKRLRDEIELAVGRINGDVGTLAWSPIRYMHQSFDRKEMVALYRAADVMLVTPLRDGMNLVAKEYIATRTDNTGVLVLSEFTGAADELKQALQVNPHDIDGLKDTLVTALQLPKRQQVSRMSRLRKQVLTNDVDKWADDFLTMLRKA